MQGRIRLRELSIGIALVAIWIAFALQTDRFLSARNLSLMSIELATTATLALGMLLVLLPGMIDLSVGSGLGLIGGMASVLIFKYQWPAPAAMGIGLLCAVVVWALMGKLIAAQGIPAFIITLGGLLVFKGTFWLVIQNATVPVTVGGRSNLYSLLTTYYLPPLAGYVLALLIAAVLVLSRLQARRLRLRHGFAVDDAEKLFLELFVVCQFLLLVVVLMNGFRGVPLCAVI